MEQVLRDLVMEAYGALGWLQGFTQLSDRARAYKVKKLQEALAAAEVCLLVPAVLDSPWNCNKHPNNLIYSDDGVCVQCIADGCLAEGKMLTIAHT